MAAGKLILHNGVGAMSSRLSNFQYDFQFSKEEDFQKEYFHIKKLENTDVNLISKAYRSLYILNQSYAKIAFELVSIIQDEYMIKKDA